MRGGHLVVVIGWSREDEEGWIGGKERERALEEGECVMSVDWVRRESERECFLYTSVSLKGRRI